MPEGKLNPRWDCLRIIQVRFCSHNGLNSDITACPKSARFGLHAPAANSRNLDGLCGAFNTLFDFAAQRSEIDCLGQ